MKYFLIAGEASGDLHASNLMAALKEQDAEADFRFLGGDLMQAVGGTLVKHYRDMAFMGFIPVLLNLGTILDNMKACQEEIRQYRPDVVILIDYPGFNLKIAKYVKKQLGVPVYYYISPKIWAWKKYRIKDSVAMWTVCSVFCLSKWSFSEALTTRWTMWVILRSIRLPTIGKNRWSALILSARTKGWTAVPYWRCWRVVAARKSKTTFRPC
ncbi:putative lipid-A-disaccharide synthetase [Parabacteroides johnsonii DSM 18315]|uniref:Lipid-A-disaccharide synthase n=1 Tax=Parabacteroides johnsonii DSM 18315 TaxID=537006 RepID=B7B599_9BACT|nr:putative lipid-A-disaccharide synthetase [Parabacteroides johnsonii DSM 18315]